MKKRILLIGSLMILGVFCCFIGMIAPSAAKDVKITFKRVTSLSVPATLKNEGYTSVQSMVYTGKYFAFMLTNTAADDQAGSNALYVMKYNSSTSKWEYYKTIKKLSYGHGNDMAYIQKDNTIAISFKDYKTKNGYVAFLDADTFKEKSRVQVAHSFGSIAYDKSLDRYYLGVGSSAKGAFIYTICDGKVSNATCKASVFTSERRMTGQGCESHDGYFYKTNYDAGKTTVYQEGSALGYKGGEIDVYDKDYKQVRRFIFNSNNGTVGTDIGEIEGVDFIGETPYFLFNGNTTGDNTMARVYIPIYTARNVNAKIITKVSTNNKTAFQKLNLKANFSSTSPSTNKNISFASNGYTLSNIAINKAGTYTFNIKQKTTSSSNWKFDTSTKKATIKVKYSLSVNNLIYSTSFSKGDNTFLNTFTYTPVTVPISVKVSTSKQDSSLKNPTLKATLYKDGKKVETVSANNGKYTFKSIKFTEKGTNTYTIKQENSGTTKDGIYINNIDSSTITVTIKVAEGDTALTSKTTYSKSTFSNKVTAKYNEIDNKVEVKIKTTKSDNSVPIKETTATLVQNNKVIETKPSQSDKYTFNIKIDSPGTYKYTILQDTNLTGDGIYSYTLDKNTITVTIKATIENDKLVCTSSLSKNTFTNKIVANYEEIKVPIQAKISTSKSKDTIPTPTTKAILVKNNKKIELTNEGEYYTYTDTIKTPGVYKYTLEQKDIEDDEDYFYDIDDKKITYTVTVTNNNGVLKYDITPASAVFTNEIGNNYDSINITLTSSIATELSSNSITIPITQAYLYQEDTLIKTVNSSKKKYTFTNISIDSPGTYIYKIKQAKQGTEENGNYTYEYDGDVITATIVVTSSNETLIPKITYSKKTFKNKITLNYEKITVPITINISNDIDDTAITVPTTKASIYQNDEKLSTVSSNNNKYSYTVTFDKPGKYVYEIKQDSSGVHKTNDYNYFLDDDTKTCTIIVSEENESLTYKISYSYNDFTFENSYIKKYDAISIPIEVPINTTKLSTNIKDPSTKAILLEDKEEIEKINSKNGKYQFSEIEILTPGVYIYEIKQENAGNSINGVYEYNLDENIITVEIEVKINNSKLEYTINYDKERFENEVIAHYEAITIPLEVSITEDNIDNINTTSYAIISDAEKVLDVVGNTNKKYNSTNVKIDKEGTYKLKIRQKKPFITKKDGIKKELDDKIITATIDVKDVNGTLTYLIQYDSNNYSNKFTPTTESEDYYANVPINIDIYSNTSKINELNLKATLFEEDIPIETVEKESSSFSYELDLLPGEYKYTIKQVNIEDNNWDIDDEVIEVNITVKDDLTYEIQYREDISSFTDNDINIADTTAEDDVLTGIPNTARFLNRFLEILGIFLILIGFGIFYFNLSDRKAQSN